MGGSEVISRRNFWKKALKGFVATSTVLGASHGLSRVTEPDYQEEIGRFIEYYSNFFGIERKVLEDEVRVTHSGLLIPSALFEMNKPNSTTINLLKIDPLWINRFFGFSHEVRHVIHYQIGRGVINENPDRFLKYVKDNYGEIESSDLVSKVLEFRDKYGKGNSSELHRDVEFRKELGNITQLYFNLLMNKRYDLLESFANDGKLVDRLTYPALTLGGLLFAFFYGKSIYYKLPDKINRRKMISNLSRASVHLVALIFLIGYSKNFLLKGEEPLSNKVLARFPKSDRRYLLTFLPERGTSFESQLEKLKEYGFPIKYRSASNM